MVRRAYQFVEERQRLLNRRLIVHVMCHVLAALMLHALVVHRMLALMHHRRQNAPCQKGKQQKRSELSASINQGLIARWREEQAAGGYITCNTH